MNALKSARSDLERARLMLESATQNARIAATEAAAGGTPETVIARELGVNRLTVRSWLGK